MKMKQIYTFTDEELQELVNDGTSRVFIKKSVLHVSLHAYHFADLKQSLCDIFDESINHFKSELGGIVLSYRNIKVLNNIGRIINDDSRIFIDVQADYYVFSPEIDCVLTGIVNKKSNDHVGCLVHKLFNVSIPRPEGESWDGETIQIGQKITFKVEFMDFNLNLPYIRGKLVVSSSHPKLTEEHVKKKKKKKDKVKDEDVLLDNQLAEVEANHGDEKQEESAVPQNIKKEKKKDKKNKKHIENLNQQEQLLRINSQDSGESENLYQSLEDKLDSKSSGEALAESMDWNTSRDLSDVSMFACSTQNEEVSPKKKKKKKKSKDLDNVNVEDNSITVDNSEASQELINSSHKEELVDIPKKKRKKLFMNSSDILIVNNDDADHANEELAEKKKPKKHKKHKQRNVDVDIESGEMALQNIKPEECEITTKILTNASSGAENVKSGKTKKHGSSDVHRTNSVISVDISNEDDHIEAAASKKKNKHASKASLQSPTAKAEKNLNTTVDSSIDSDNPVKEASKKKSSEAKLDAIPAAKKKKSIRFSTDLETIHGQDDTHANSEQSDMEVNKEKISNTKESESDSGESSSFISGTSVASPFSSSIYSGANMVNSMDRKRKKVIKLNEDIATLKRPINSISPSLISATRALLQNLPEPKIKDPTALSVSPSSSPEKVKEESFRGIRSPQDKSDSEQGNLSSSPSKPLTQKKSVSSQSKIDGNVYEAINAIEPSDFSNFIARMSSSENTVVQKQEQAPKSPKADKEKKNKKKKKVETDSKGDSHPADHNSKDTGKKSNVKVSAGVKTEINTTELPNISELIARINSEKSGTQKQEVSPKSPKSDKDKKSKTKKKEVKEASTKAKHKEHKKDKKSKDEKKEDKSKKKEDKIKKENKTSKEKKKTEKENDLTDLSRKLLQEFLKKQNSN